MCIQTSIKIGRSYSQTHMFIFYVDSFYVDTLLHCINLYSYQKCMKMSFITSPVHLAVRKWYFTTLSICIFLILVELVPSIHWTPKTKAWGRGRVTERALALRPRMGQNNAGLLCPHPWDGARPCKPVTSYWTTDPRNSDKTWQDKNPQSALGTEHEVWTTWTCLPPHSKAATCAGLQDWLLEASVKPSYLCS